MARSASPTFVTAVHKKYPGLIDAMVLMSPEKPGDFEIAELQHAALIENVAKWGGAIKAEANKWYEHLKMDVDWNDPDYFAQVLVLIMTGGNDTEVIKQERDFYNHLTSTHSNIRAVNVLGADHNTFNLGKNRETGQSVKQSGRQSYKVFYDFLHNSMGIRNQPHP